MIEVLGVKNAAKLIPTSEDQIPKDPVSENMAIINGKPIKAFQYQDHESHIAVHMAAMQDPKLAAMIGQDPMAQTIQASATAHIREHLAFAYKAAIEQKLGVPLPNVTDDEPMPPDVEVQVSKMAAQAAQQLLQSNQAEAAQQQAQQAAQDPIVQQQAQELAIREREVKVKEEKLKVDAAALVDKTEMAQAALDSKERIAGVQIGAKSAADKDKIDHAGATLLAKMIGDASAQHSDGVKTAIQQKAANKKEPE